MNSLFLLTSLVPFVAGATSQLVPAASAASQFSLSTSTALPFPTATLSNSDTQSFLTTNWGLSKGKIQNGASDLVFVADPFPNAPVPTAQQNVSGPVLQVTYPKGSFKDDNSGGAQMYALVNATGQPFQSMLVSYEVAFDAGFDWVKGGKLPGIRGGPDPNGCSGGNQPNGTNCFSTRVMWRKDGAGEVYAYIPRTNNICKSSNITCNDEFGVSINRGAFSFASGQWNRISLLVRLNNPPNVANGQVLLYYNDVQALSQDNLQLRSSNVINAGGFYFSTFFGGDDASWAPSSTTHTYFRNVQVFAGTNPSDLQGSNVNGGGRTSDMASTWAYVACVFVGALMTRWT